jgi:hypothetical protein
MQTSNLAIGAANIVVYGRNPRLRPYISSFTSHPFVNMTIDI